MKGKKLIVNVSRLLAFVMLFSLIAVVPLKARADEGDTLADLIAIAEELKAGNSEFPVQVAETEDGSDVDQAFPWVYEAEMDAIEAAIAAAQAASEDDAQAKADLEAAIETFSAAIKSDGSDPYFRLDPGLGQVPVVITEASNEWTWRSRPLDNRVPSDYGGSTIEMIDYPFTDSEGKGQVLKINYINPGTTTFGGISIQCAFNPTVNVPTGSNIEFDVYYPANAEGKFMRWRMQNRGSNIDSYLRSYQYHNLNPDWVDTYMGETWFKTHVSETASTGSTSTFVLELHGESARPAEESTLIVSNIVITAPDPSQEPLPTVVNAENQSVVAPLKSLYNEEDGLFLVGALGAGRVTGTRARHYSIFLDGNNMKADSTHPRGPSWLKDADGNAVQGANTTPGIGEYRFPDSSYSQIRDSGEPGEYLAHAHVLAWYNQAPSWMNRLRPKHLTQGYEGSLDFYALGNGVSTTVPVEKEMAKRVQFNHIVYVMRHMLTTEEKYGSSESRGVIPFHSWDVLNEEVHESRTNTIIPNDPDAWRNCLKHTNWLVAMSDDDITGDLSDHYVYLLFKFAHIAAPNAQMAAAYKANYDSLPEYMKLDGHDKDGSIDDYIQENPPLLTYNDYGIATRTKGRAVYNMVKDLNTAWQSDPLYDGRPLIEVVGIQGHDSLSPTLASDNQYAMGLYASLCDQGLLTGISFSEFDLKILTDAPGGGATAPAALNVRQSDALGYEYALMYKLFTKFAPYVDHIISWGVQGSGWQGSYVLFDNRGNANAGYYGAMNPDRYILGHSYLDYYFAGEYDQILEEGVDLEDLGYYVPAKFQFNEEITGVEAHLYSHEAVFTVSFSGHVRSENAEVAIDGIDDYELAWEDDKLIITVPKASVPDIEEAYLTVTGLLDHYKYPQEEALEAALPIPTEIELQNSVSLSLEGNIAANFYLDLDGYEDIDRIEITYSDPTAQTKTMITDVYYDYADLEVDGFYKFAVEAAACQVADPITVTVYGRYNEVLYNETTSVKEILESYIEAYPDDEQIVDLCTALLTYAGYAQIYFGYEGALAFENYEADISGVDAASLAQYKAAWADPDAGDGIAYAGQVFSCRSNTVMKYYFTAPKKAALADFEAEFASGGEGMTIELSLSGNYVVVSISDIAGAQLDNEYSITLSYQGAFVGTLTASPLAYAKSVIASGSDENLVNLVKAIAVYAEAASAFFGD